MKLRTKSNSYLIIISLLIMSIRQGGSGESTENNALISIASWNSRGMLTSIPYLNNLMKENDIIAISEHWQHANCLHKLLNISDEFYCISRASKHSSSEQYGVRRGQGGVAIFWRKSLSGISPISEITHDRICGLRLQTESKCIVNIFSIYLLSQGSSDDFDTVVDEVSEIINDREHNAFNIVCGDYNGDVGYLGGKRSNRKPNKNGIRVSKFFEEFSLFPTNLSQIATGPVITFKGGMGSSTIDFIAIPEGLRNNLASCEVLCDNTLNTSDHYAVQSKLKLQCLPPMIPCSNQKGKISWKKAGTILKFQNLVRDNVNKLVTEFDHENCSIRDIECVLNDLVKYLADASDKLPRAKFRSNVKPYWNPTLTNLKKVKVTCYKLWKDAGKPRDADNYLFQEHKRARKDFMRELKRVQKEYQPFSLMGPHWGWKLVTRVCVTDLSETNFF